MRQKGSFMSYAAAARIVQRMFEDGNYKFIKHYENFDLYGKYDGSGKLLWKECFSDFDIGKREAVAKRKEHKPYVCKTHKGGN